jgi:hypothetical protein
MPALLQREGKVDRWNDDRLDELSRRIDAGFAETKTEVAALRSEMSRGFEQVNRGFEQVNQGFQHVALEFSRLNGRLDKLMLAIVVGGLGLAGGVIASLVAVVLS